jgi:2-aminoadipate transaminase
MVWQSNSIAGGREMDVSSLLASRTRTMGVNAIREILKVVSRPGMISLAGGIPAPESFPLDLMGRLHQAVLDKYGAGALQYDPTEGFGPLREALVDYLERFGIRAAARQILVASGSQGVLDALGMVLISKGDRVVVESPTYIGALQAFGPYEPQYMTVATDDQGLIPEALESVLRRERVKFIYLVPTFQNPTGRTLSLERRKAVAGLIQRYGVLLVEDDPYSALRYEGDCLPSIKSLAWDHVVYVGTLSKVFAPGLRIGFCVAPAALRKWLVIVKQGIDLHTSTLGQALAAEYLAGGYLQSHLPKILALYRPRQQALLAAVERFFPPGFRWSRPQGGMFVWARGPEGMDMAEVYDKAIARNVAFVPGQYFYARPGQGRETLRLNYTMSDEATLTRAVAILGEVFESVCPLAR